MYLTFCFTAEELSIVLANRSAALNHLEQFEDTLDDIKRCLSLGYPGHLRFKVYERKARSLLLLKRNKEAITAFQYVLFYKSLTDKSMDAKARHCKVTGILDFLNHHYYVPGTQSAL